MKIFMSLTILVILGTLATETSAQKKACACPAVYSPVCATNGQTYSSKCTMSCAGAQFQHEGQCGSGGGQKLRF